jgi:nucleotide-binding universal stress UspA family protein
MFQKVLLAVALQHWDVPSPHARAAREVAVQLAKGSSYPLYVLTVYSYPALPLVQPPLVGPKIVEESQQLLMAEEAALHADMEAKLRAYVQAIAQAGVRWCHSSAGGARRRTWCAWRRRSGAIAW